MKRGGRWSRKSMDNITNRSYCDKCDDYSQYGSVLVTNSILVIDIHVIALSNEPIFGNGNNRKKRASNNRIDSSRLRYECY